MSIPLFAYANFLEGRFDPERIDVEEGRRRIEAFRDLRYKGDYSLKFELIHMPRRGGCDIYAGTLWGSWNSQGPVTRVDLKPYSSNLMQGPNQSQRSIKLLIQNGPFPKIWFLDENGKVKELNQKNWFDPLVENTVYTAFDLSLSFLFWEKFNYEGPKRVKGRVAQVFVMHPSADFARIHPGLSGVRIAMDTDYNVLLRADVLVGENNPMKSIELNNFKKVKEEYVIKQMDVVDSVTHDKTRFEVSAAALGLSIDPSYFKPELLDAENPKIGREHYEFLN